MSQRYQKLDGRQLVLGRDRAASGFLQDGNMAKLRFRIAMSLDGYTAGPQQSVQNPLGIGGNRLHKWAFSLAVFRKLQGMEGGEVNESTRVIEESLPGIGATIMGRNMFGGHHGPWNAARPWNGWWGADPPFHHPVFVLTHHPRPPLTLEGGTTFTFVTDGVTPALELARQAARGQDVSLGGGANVAQQYLRAGLVDQMEIHLVPILLGAGEPLFDGIGDLGGLQLARTVAAPDVTHLKFVRGQ
jgi:dihydrofolate reductase